MNKYIKILKNIITILLFVMIIMIINMIKPLKVMASDIFEENVTYKYEYCPEPENGSNDYGEMKFSLFTPSTVKQNESIPLVIYLHGKSDMAYRNEGAVRDRGWAKIFKNWENTNLEGINAYVLCPLSTVENPWTNSGDVQKLKQLLEGIIEDKNIDRNNIILAGHSSGANGAIYMTCKMPEYFSKNIIMSGFGFQSYCTPEEYAAFGIETRAYTGSTSKGEFSYSVGPTRNEFEPLFGTENVFYLDSSHNDVPKMVLKKDDDNNGRPDVLEWSFGEYSKPNTSKENFFGKDITFEPIVEKDASMPYMLLKPSTANKASSLPLILSLHGSGERMSGIRIENFADRGIPNVFIEKNWKLEGFNAYILCPQTSGYWDSEGDKEKLDELLKKIIKEYNIDTNQIMIIGHSMGGRGTLYMAHQLPEYFAKAVVLSGYPQTDASIDISEINIPVRGYVGKSGEDSVSIGYMRNKFAPTFGTENTFEIEAYHGQVPSVAFNLDEDGNNRSDIIEWMFDDYDGALILGNEDNLEFEDIISPSTGLDTYTGIFLEPIIHFFGFLVDSIISLFTSIMTQSEFLFVMGKIEEIPNLGEPAITYTITNLDAYRKASGALDLKYPRFTYTPEEIFSGKIDFLNANFILKSNEDESWNKIREVVSTWYQILRYIAIIGLLAVLIYTGIKIILSSSAKEKGKYKQLIGNWFVALLLACTMHYIMAFILVVCEQVTQLLSRTVGTIQVNADQTFNTNLLGLARFQMQQQQFSDKIGHLIIYTALVTFTIKFTFVYLKRVLNMAFLTIISPIVALTYPIDKMDGDAKGFNMWIKEFTFNAILQPFHYILYYILVSTSLSLAITNPIYAIAAIMFISHAEKLLKRVFGFDKAGAGTVGGIAGAFTTGYVTSSFMKLMRDPLHPFSGGKNGGKKGNGNSSDGDEDNDYLNLDDINTDAEDYDELQGIFGGASWNPSNNDGTGGNSGGTGLPNVNDYIQRYRQDVLGQMDLGDLGDLKFQDNDNKSIEAILKMLGRKRAQLEFGNVSAGEEIKLQNQISGLEALLDSRIAYNEEGFEGAPQYADGDKRSNREILDEIKKLQLLSANPKTSATDRNKYIREISNLRQKLDRRMKENQYITDHGGIEAIRRQYESQQQNNNTNTNTTSQDNRSIPPTMPEQNNHDNQPRMIKGIKHVLKEGVKPIWDTEKDADEEAIRLVGNIIRKTAGITLGIGAAAVQAGISITDGKYKPAEGIATMGAGIAFASNVGKGNNELVRAYKEGRDQGIEGKDVEEYGKQWFNRDDVIRQYNREFPGQGKEMRERARNNYISRGITEVDDQVKAMRYAEQLKKERGMTEEEADKAAIATLQYKKSLGGNYKVLFDKDKRKEFIDLQVNSYTGASSKDSIRRVHENLLESILDFDRANR